MAFGRARPLQCSQGDGLLTSAAHSRHGAWHQGVTPLDIAGCPGREAAPKEAPSFARSNISLEMGFADVWNKTLVYFGIAEEDDWDEDGYVTDEELQRAYAERPNVRRLAPAPSKRRDREFDDWTDPEPESNDRTAVMRQPRQRATVTAVPSPASVRVHLVVPRSFNDAQQIADKFKDSIPVILNLQSSDQDLSKRLIDFASGLTYALDGGMQRVADKVFLLTPRNVEVSAEERARLLERGGFFNQA
jgi:cell division inhibitor SepF